MASVRVDRMRKVLAASREDTEHRRYASWLASLEPEHRARHERGYLMCGECINASAAETARLMAESFARITGTSITNSR